MFKTFYLGVFLLGGKLPFFILDRKENLIMAIENPIFNPIQCTSE